MANIGKGKEVDESFKFDVTSQVSFDGAPAPESKNPPIWVWFSVAGLLIIALLVIFVLPTIVNKYQLPLEPRISPPNYSKLEVLVQPPLTYHLLNKLSGRGSGKRRKIFWQRS